MSELRIITDYHEKQKTRALYEQAFDDPEIFVDYYYKYKCVDNVIITEVEDDKILSMAHLNPYEMNFGGISINTYYIVAVATDENHRRQGCMKRVMNEAFTLMKREKIPFCWLLPVDEAIYNWMGFETICNFRRNKLTYNEIKVFDVYCIHNEKYIERATLEAELTAKGVGEALPDNPVIMSKIIDGKAFDRIAQEAFGAKTRNDAERLNLLRSKKIYIDEEV